MSDHEDLEKQLTNILHQAAKQLNLTNYGINLNLDVNLGDGFMGEFYKVSLINHDNQEEIFMVVKRAPQDIARRQAGSIDDVYFNEVYFYTKIVPALRGFIKEKEATDSLYSYLPEFVTSRSEELKEAIVMHDITKNGYILREKELMLDDEHAELVFTTYGKFHGVSFAFKDQQPEEYKKLVKSIKPVYERFSLNSKIVDFYHKKMVTVYESLKNEKHKQAFEKYTDFDTFGKIFQDVSVYNGENQCILHGDCWSNNMMYKYKDENTLEGLAGITLIDFQLIHSGTPAYDLAYFFYASASDELYNKWGQYLDLYFKSFSETVIALGSDPEKLFTKKKLLEDWKKYAKLGMIMTVLIAKLKLITKEAAVAINGSDQQSANQFHTLVYDERLYAHRMEKMIAHMYEFGDL